MPEVRIRARCLVRKPTRSGHLRAVYIGWMEEHPNYSAMTVNERLVTAGLLEAFSVAARSRDRDTMIRLLAQVDVEQPALTVSPILNDPARYGY